MKRTYTIIVHKEDDGYWAECAELQGCYAQAKSIEELEKLMKTSICLHFNQDSKKVVDKSNEIELELSYA